MRKIFGMTILLLTLSACTFTRSDPFATPPRDSIMPGEMVTVEKNQNAYAFARHHNVPMRALIVLNDLRPPYNLRAGQQLTLPIITDSYGASYSGDEARPPQAAPAPLVESAPIDLGGEPPPINDSSVTAAPLEPPPSTPAPQPETQTRVDPLSPTNLVQQARPVETTVAEARPTSAAGTNVKEKPETSAPADQPAGKFQWPLQGTILSGFGPKDGGLNNDGINIAAPKGAPVAAAAGGIVVHAGNEMKGFGNLVLIRHEDGWVTAYAHLDRVLVSKDSVVAAGDMIGTVGATGGVNTPQLHFETRLNGKPVDPQTVIKE